MKKKTIRKEVLEPIYTHDCISMSNLEDFVFKLKRKNATYVELKYGEEGEFAIQGYIEREETDAEFEERKRNAERAAENQKAYDMKVYERIKSQYNL